MKTVLQFALITGLLAACAQDPTAPPTDTAATGTGPNLAALAITDNQIIPIDLLVNIPCANGGLGEDVLLSGSLHVITHLTFSNSGTVTIKTHFQPQGISGVGQVTGAKYQATGVTQDILNLSFGENYTLVNNFRMIGQGPGNNFTVHENFHYTINANGTLTSVHDNFTADCK
jgi:hypothetical protein